MSATWHGGAAAVVTLTGVAGVAAADLGVPTRPHRAPTVDPVVYPA